MLQFFSFYLSPLRLYLLIPGPLAIFVPLFSPFSFHSLHFLSLICFTLSFLTFPDSELSSFLSSPSFTSVSIASSSPFLHVTLTSHLPTSSNFLYCEFSFTQHLSPFSPLPPHLSFSIFLPFFSFCHYRSFHLTPPSQFVIPHLFLTLLLPNSFLSPIFLFSFHSVLSFFPI